MKKNDIIIRSSAAEYLIYMAAVGDNPESIEIRYQDENVWLTQKMMAQLYDVRTINEHISHIFNDGELDQGATVRNFRIVQIEGSRNVSREVMYYNLQMIIAVGFKVNNEKAVQIRKWANSIVKDYTFLSLMDREILMDTGRVTAELAKRHAESEFEKYRIIQNQLYLSDFDKFLLLEEEANKK